MWLGDNEFGDVVTMFWATEEFCKNILCVWFQFDNYESLGAMQVDQVRAPTVYVDLAIYGNYQWINAYNNFLKYILL